MFPMFVSEKRNSKILCVVCGAPSIGRNFDAFTCLSCKAFFRRNGHNDKLRYTCRVIGACPITMTTRRHCSACRLNKCFQQGMKKELIRSLISIRQSSSSVNRTMPMMSVIGSVQNLFLTSQDWSRLTNLRYFYENFTVKAFVDSHHHIPLTLQTQPCRTRFKLQRFIDLHSKYIQVVALFIQHVSQLDPFLFNYYPLIKKNFQVLSSINISELMNCHVLDDFPWKYDRFLYESILSSSIVQRLEENQCFYKYYLPDDPFTVKLYMIILALTPSVVPLYRKTHYHSSDFHPYPMVILGIQNYYLNLLWKYNIYRFNERQTISYLVSLVQNFLRQQKLEADIIEHLLDRDDYSRFTEILTNF